MNNRPTQSAHRSTTRSYGAVDLRREVDSRRISSYLKDFQKRPASSPATRDIENDRHAGLQISGSRKKSPPRSAKNSDKKINLYDPNIDSNVAVTSVISQTNDGVPVTMEERNTDLAALSPRKTPVAFGEMFRRVESEGIPLRQAELDDLRRRALDSPGINTNGSLHSQNGSNISGLQREQEYDDNIFRLGKMVVQTMLCKPDLRTTGVLSKYFFDEWAASHSSPLPTDANVLHTEILEEVEGHFQLGKEQTEISVAGRLAFEAFDAIIDRIGHAVPTLAVIRDSLLPLVFQDMHGNDVSAEQSVALEITPKHSTPVVEPQLLADETGDHSRAQGISAVPTLEDSTTAVSPRDAYNSIDSRELEPSDHVDDTNLDERVAGIAMSASFDEQYGDLTYPQSDRLTEHGELATTCGGEMNTVLSADDRSAVPDIAAGQLLESSCALTSGPEVKINYQGMRTWYETLMEQKYQMNKLNREVKENVDELERKRHALCESEEKISELTAEVTNLRTTNARLTKENNEHRAVVMSLRNDVSELRSSSEMERALKEQYSVKLEPLEVEVKDSREYQADAESRFRAFEGEVLSLQLSLEDMKQEKETLKTEKKAAKDEILRIQAEKGRLMKDLESRLRQNFEWFDSTSNQLAELRASMGLLTKDPKGRQHYDVLAAGVTRSPVDEKLFDTCRYREYITDWVGHITKDINELLNQQQSLEKDIKDSQQLLDRTKTEHALEKQEMVERHASEREALLKSADEVRRSNLAKIRRMGVENALLSGNVKNLKAELKETTQKYEDICNIQAPLIQAKRLLDDRMGMINEDDMLRESLEDRRDELEGARFELHKLKEELSAGKRDMGTMRRQLTERSLNLESKLMASEEGSKVAMSKFEEERQLIKAAHTWEISVLEEKVNEKQSLINRRDQEIESLNEKNTELRSEISRLQDAADYLQADIDNLTGKMNLLQIENDALVDSKSALGAESNKVAGSLEEANEEINRLHSKNKVLANDNERINREKVVAQREKDSLQRKLVQQQQEELKLMVQLQELQREHKTERERGREREINLLQQLQSSASSGGKQCDENCAIAVSTTPTFDPADNSDSGKIVVPNEETKITVDTNNVEKSSKMVQFGMEVKSHEEETKEEAVDLPTALAMLVERHGEEDVCKIVREKYGGIPTTGAAVEEEMSAAVEETSPVSMKTKKPLLRQSTFYDHSTYEAVSVAPPRGEEVFKVFAEQMRSECKKFKHLLAYLMMEKQQIQRELRKFSDLFNQATVKVKQEIKTNMESLSSIDISNVLSDEMARRLSVQRVNSLTPDQLKLINQEDLMKLGKKFGRRGSLAAVLPNLPEINAGEEDISGAVESKSDQKGKDLNGKARRKSINNKGTQTTPSATPLSSSKVSIPSEKIVDEFQRSLPELTKEAAEAAARASFSSIEAQGESQDENLGYAMSAETNNSIRRQSTSSQIATFAVSVSSKKASPENSPPIKEVAVDKVNNSRRVSESLYHRYHGGGYVGSDGLQHHSSPHALSQPFIGFIRRNEKVFARENGLMKVALREFRVLYDSLKQELNYLLVTTPFPGQAASRGMKRIFRSLQVMQEQLIDHAWVFDPRYFVRKVSSHPFEDPVDVNAQMRSVVAYQSIMRDLDERPQEQPEEVVFELENLLFDINMRARERGGWRSALYRVDGSVDMHMSLEPWIAEEKISILKEQLRYSEVKKRQREMELLHKIKHLEAKVHETQRLSFEFRKPDGFNVSNRSDVAATVPAPEALIPISRSESSALCDNNVTTDRIQSVDWASPSESVIDCDAKCALPATEEVRRGAILDELREEKQCLESALRAAMSTMSQLLSSEYQTGRLGAVDDDGGVQHQRSTLGVPISTAVVTAARSGIASPHDLETRLRIYSDTSGAQDMPPVIEYMPITASTSGARAVSPKQQIRLSDLSHQMRNHQHLLVRPVPVDTTIHAADAGSIVVSKRDLLKSSMRGFYDLQRTKLRQRKINKVDTTVRATAKKKSDAKARNRPNSAAPAFNSVDRSLSRSKTDNATDVGSRVRASFGRASSALPGTKMGESIANDNEEPMERPTQESADVEDENHSGAPHLEMQNSTAYDDENTLFEDSIVTKMHYDGAEGTTQQLLQRVKHICLEISNKFRLPLATSQLNEHAQQWSSTEAEGGQLQEFMANQSTRYTQLYEGLMTESAVNCEHSDVSSYMLSLKTRYNKHVLEARKLHGVIKSVGAQDEKRSSTGNDTVHKAQWHYDNALAGLALSPQSHIRQAQEEQRWRQS